jgi:hypothetical protein
MICCQVTEAAKIFVGYRPGSKDVYYPSFRYISAFSTGVENGITGEEVAKESTRS